MRTKTNKVYLSSTDRAYLQKVVKSGKHSSEKVRRANILLLLDEVQGNVKTQKEIAEITQSNTTTVSQMAKKYVENGIAGVERKKAEEPPHKPIVTGEIEGHIIAINCSEAPAGHKRWTLRLTSERLVELGIVDSIGKDTVGKALKTN